MIYESSKVSASRRVNDVACVDSKHVAATDAPSLVASLALIGDEITYHFAHVLDHHLVSGDRFHGKEAPAVNSRPGEFDLFLANLREREKKMWYHQIGYRIYY